MRTQRWSVFGAASLGLVLSACGAEALPIENGGESLGETQTPLLTSTSLYNEGSCGYLKICSGPSKSHGYVFWGCQTRVPPLAMTGCADSDAYLANLEDYCGLTFTITANGRTTTGTVRDISNKSVWEGSPTVISALGGSPTENSKSCTGAPTLSAKVNIGTLSGFTTVSPGQLKVNQTTSVTFKPGKPGYHAMDYLNNQGVFSSGTAKFCWFSTIGGGESCWATRDIGPGWRREILWSGSADIAYKVYFTAAKTATFYTRTYTAP